MLHEQIQKDIQQALREKNEAKLNALRGVLTAITNELVARKQKPNEMLADEAVQAVIRREVKKRKDAIEQFERGGRVDLAENERRELEYISVYLPADASDEEIAALVKRKQEELGITDRAQAGRLIGAVMKELSGRADGSRVKHIVDSLFTDTTNI